MTKDCGRLFKMLIFAAGCGHHPYTINTIDNYEPTFDFKRKIDSKGSKILKKETDFFNDAETLSKIESEQRRIAGTKRPKHEKNIEFDSSDSVEETTEFDEPVRSYTKGRINTDAANLNQILHRELGDVSADLGAKVEQAIKNVSRETPKDFKEVIIIKKRILSDGKRKVVNLNVREKVVPKDGDGGAKFRDFYKKAFWCLLIFFVSGLIFTACMKLWENQIWAKFFRFGEKSDAAKITEVF